MSTLRDEYPSCPGCGDAMDTVREDKRYNCAGCKSTLISEPEVLAVIAAVVADPPDHVPFDPPMPLFERTYTCPRCQQAMTKHGLYSIQVDRCEKHGVWFEGGELQRILEKLSLDHRQRLPLSQKIVVGASTVALLASYIASFLIGR